MLEVDAISETAVILVTVKSSFVDSKRNVEDNNFQACRTVMPFVFREQEAILIRRKRETRYSRV